MLKILTALICECLKPIFESKHGVKAIRGCVGKLDLASSGPFSAWPHPAASTIEQTSPASPSLPGEKTARSRADDGVFRQSLVLLCVLFSMQLTLQETHAMESLPGTKPLAIEGDIAARLVDTVDRFLLREIKKAKSNRARFWRRDFSSVEKYHASIQPNRDRLAHILGVRDQRIRFDALELVSTTKQPALVARGYRHRIYAVRWPVIRNIQGEGLLLVPEDEETIVGNVVAIPDADQTPEQLAGLGDGLPPESQFARRLAEMGFRVVVPVLISRETKRRAPPGQDGRADLTHREFLYRSAFELGRHLIGYEIQKVLAVIDWFEQEGRIRPLNTGVMGYGEGGMLALFAGALDTRIDVTCVMGFFGPREGMWQEPLDRNVFGLLQQFGAAELATLVLPRALIVEDSEFPEVELSGRGGAPGRLTRPDRVAVRAVRDRAKRLVPAIGGKPVSTFLLVESERLLDDRTMEHFGRLMSDPSGTPQPRTSISEATSASAAPEDRKPTWSGPPIDAAVRQRRQVDQIDQHNQWLLRESPFVRKKFMSQLDTSSIEAYQKSVEPYREIFRDEVIGRFDYQTLPFNARTRKSWETDKWTGFEVMLDVWPEVFAYGVLLLPKDLDLDGSEKRPVVVCQHGLEGRPTDTFLKDHRAYHDFAAKLTERGFITFAPQNLYLFGDRFRTLQRKANSLGKTLFSIIVPQHQQIVDWLQSLPYVDADRVAFYGLSYGGKTAMRVPALVTDYCLSICSADFNDWVRKNASSRHSFSYVWTGEYEIFEFDLGSTFNYAEMAALICPRPFMVERGHFDGVGWDEWVAYEYAKVRHLYQAKLGIGERTEIEWFAGPHTINGKGTFDFLHRHLHWPRHRTH